jgi:FMN-dependent NADH-azoreductase
MLIEKNTRRDQVKHLEIQSSSKGESSDSITLTKSFIEACKSANTSIVVDTLNVWHERLPEYDYEFVLGPWPLEEAMLRGVDWMRSGTRRSPGGFR